MPIAPATPAGSSGEEQSRRPAQPTMLPNGEPTTEAQSQAVAARERCKSERGVRAHKQRMADAEGVIGELKNRHALDRVRSRGTPLFHVRLLLGCTALDCKRLADHVPEAASGVASAPTVAASDPQPVAAASQADHSSQGAAATAASSALTAPATSWSYSICLN